MASPFIAEIKMFGGNFAPRNFAFCNGQILAIAQNTALFSLLGTTYGGNGQTTFALPDLRNRAPLHPGQGPGLSDRLLGETGGEDNHTLTTQEMPAHTHTVNASTTGAPSTSPTNRFPGQVPTLNLYGTATDATMAAGSVATVGGGLPHENRQPFLYVNFIIALQGVFPSRN